MSIDVKYAFGIFEADDSPYRATAILALKEIQDFSGKVKQERAKEVTDVLQNKHPEMEWFTVCHSYGVSWNQTNLNVLWLTRDGLSFGIVTVNDKEDFDKLTKDQFDADKALREKDDAIKVIQQQLEDAQSQLASALQTITDRDNTLRQADVTIKNKNDQQIEAQAQLTATNNELLQAKQTIIQKQEEIVDLENELIQKEETIKKTNDQLNEVQAKLKAAINSLEQTNQRTLEEKVQREQEVNILLREKALTIERVSRELMDEKQKYKIANESLLEKQPIIDDLQKQIQSAKLTIDQNQQQVEQHQIEIKDINIILEQANQRIAHLEAVPEQQNQIGMNEIQMQLIQVLQENQNQIKDQPIAKDDLNKYIKLFVKVILQLLNSQCKEQVKDKLPEQIQKLLEIAKNFDDEKLKQLTANVRQKNATTTEKLEELQETLEFLGKRKNKKDHQKQIQETEEKIKLRESEILELKQEEQEIIKKFEMKMKNVLEAIDAHLEEILKSCVEESKLKLVLVIESQLVQDPQEECKETPADDI